MNEKEIKIAYCTWTNPNDKRSWSGSHYFILKALSSFASVDILGPLPNKYIVPVKLFKKFIQIIFRKNISHLHTPLVSQEYAKQLEKKLYNKKYDYIFCPANSEIIADLKTDIPIIYLSDATFASMIDYYPEFRNLSTFAKKWGFEIERRAISKSTHLIFSSDWAKKSAQNVYNCPDHKISVIPFGANIEKYPSTEEILKLRSKKITTLKLLWVGVDWNRKGGQIAYETMIDLNNQGIPTQLTICGCLPPIKNPHSNLKIEEFLNKNKPEDFTKLVALYKEANIFILPTKQECAGIVFAEAAACALPIFTFDTGGLSNYVQHGINGCKLKLNSTYKDFSFHAEILFKDFEKYKEFSINSRKKFNDELNWERWKNRVQEIIK